MGSMPHVTCASWEQGTAREVAPSFFRLSAEGHVVNVDFVVSHRQSTFIALDAQPDDASMPRDGSRQADGLAHSPLEAGASLQRRALAWLRVALGRVMSCRVEVTRVRPPMIRIIAAHPQWRQQRLQLHKDPISAFHSCSLNSIYTRPGGHATQFIQPGP